MAKEKLIFNKTTDYEELLEEMKRQIPEMSRYYFHEETLPVAIASLSTQDPNKRKRILDFANSVDRKMNFGGQAHKNRYHKIPTILAGAIYYSEYPESVEELDADEMEILAKHSITFPISFYKNATMYYTKQLLRTIYEIGPDFMFRTGYMFLTEKYFDQGKTPDEINTYFKESDLKELLEESFEYERITKEEAFKEAESHASRRI